MLSTFVIFLFVVLFSCLSCLLGLVFLCSRLSLFWGKPVFFSFRFCDLVSRAIAWICLDCPSFIWSMLYKFTVFVLFLVFWWHWPLVVWGGVLFILLISLFAWWSFRRTGRAVVRWVEANSEAFDFPSPFSRVPYSSKPSIGENPLLDPYFSLFTFLLHWVFPFVDRRVDAVRDWFSSEEHDRLVILLRVTAAFPRIPFYLFLCVLSVFCVFAFVPSILDLNLPALDE